MNRFLTFIAHRNHLSDREFRTGDPDYKITENGVNCDRKTNLLQGDL